MARLIQEKLKKALAEDILFGHSLTGRRFRDRKIQLRFA